MLLADRVGDTALTTGVEYEPLPPVVLTPDEVRFWALLRPHVDASPWTNPPWEPLADAAESLVDSLLARRAIPEVRLRLFEHGSMTGTRARPVPEVFERNGSGGREMIRHPHFLPYLRYFILGPHLPADAISGLCQILNEDRGTSGMVMDQYRAFARASIRRHRLEPRRAAAEFYKLGIEIGMEENAAQALREAAIRTRTSR